MKHDYKNLISPAQLHDIFVYDAKTGVLTWRTRTQEVHDAYRSGNKANGALHVWNKKFGGKPAGSIHKVPRKTNYLRIRLLKFRIMAHVIIWAMQTGEWPPNQDTGLTIDHRDQDGLNNRWENFRLATRSEQMKNKRYHPKSSLGP